jgi:threonine/homoserine/homoserine lactone efflux protein
VIAFLAVAVAVIVAPGPDFALVVRNGVTRRRGQATAAGVVAGQLVWVVATAGGLAALLVASRPAFEAVRLGGALYLVWLGLSTLRSRGRAEARPPRPGSAFRQGLVSNLSNPKMAVFFAGLLPQFGTGFGSLVEHGIVFAVLTLAWLSGVARASAALRRPAVRRVLDWVTGAVLVAFGIRLAADQAPTR